MFIKKVMETENIRVVKEQHKIDGKIQYLYFVHVGDYLVHSSCTAEEVMFVLSRYIDDKPQKFKEDEGWLKKLLL